MSKVPQETRETRNGSYLKKPMIVSFVIAGFAVLLGFTGTVMGMVGAFGELSENEARPDALAQNISLSLNFTMIGFAICFVMTIVGLILLSLHVKQKHRERDSVSQP